MSNLILSDICDRQCPCCFNSRRAGGVGDAVCTPFLGFDAFREHLALLRRSGHDRVRLLGGEPTLHPRFPEMVALAWEEGFGATVFTHGVISDAAALSLARLPETDCDVLVNVLASRRTGPDALRSDRADARRRCEVMTLLGQRAMPGVNLVAPDFDLEPMFDLVEETRCRAAIRLGLALPSLDRANAFLPPERYRAVGRRVAGFAESAARRGIALQFDCGFVPCMFTDAERERLAVLGVRPDWHCHPIVDLTLDGRAIPCFPLARFGIPSEAGVTIGEIRERLVVRTAPYRVAGLFPGCEHCGFRESGVCAGGCLAAALRKFRPAGFRVRVPGPIEPEPVA